MSRRIGIWRGVSAALLACTAWAVHAQSGQTAQQTHDAGRALGERLANSENERLRSGATVGATPAYDPNVPERQLYGSGASMNEAAAAHRARCQANPADTSCSALRSGTAQRQLPVVAPSNPALAGESAVRDPQAVLGNISGAYRACTASTTRMVSPATFSEHACTNATDGWSTESCTKSLTVVPRSRTSCVPGTWAAKGSARIGEWMDVTISAYCDLTATDQRFRVDVSVPWLRYNSRKEFELPADEALPLPGNDPPRVYREVIFGNEDTFVLDIYAVGPGCSAGDACERSFYLFSGPSTANGRLARARQCPAGERLGSELMMFSVCRDELGCNVPGSAAQCYARGQGSEPAAAVLAYDVGGEPSSATVWHPTEPSVPSGDVSIIPGDPVNSQMATTVVRYERPRVVAASETWSNGCQSLEAMTPALPADGAVSRSPLIPFDVEPGSTRCVKTGSVCTEGPSTRTVDGVEVTRDCWNWQNTFQCATASAASSCAPLVSAGCGLSADPVCLAVDPSGRCLRLDAKYQCRTADAVYATVTDCAGSTFCEGGSCWDTSTQPNGSLALAASHLQARMDAGNDLNPDTLEIFRGALGTCARREFGARNCCNNSADLLECPQSDQDLVQRRDAGLCHYVGEYCSSKSLVGCRTRVQAYCCFSGVLARAVQQGGHAQIGKSWGDPRGPDCSGFTVDQFAGLNWEAIDLSDWYSRINPVPPNMSAVEASNGERANTSCYYGSGQCGQ